MTQFTPQELDDYWQDTQFEFPLKEKINKMEKLDVYLMNMRSQKVNMQNSKRFVHSVGVFAVVFILTVISFFAWKHNTVNSISGLIIATIVVAASLAGVMTVAFNSYFNYVIFPKMGFVQDVMKEIKNKEKEWTNLRTELATSVLQENTKKQIIDSVAQFKTFMKKELPPHAQNFIENHSVFITLEREINKAYTENDAESVIDMLAQYALCDYDLKEEWQEINQQEEVKE